MAIAVAFDEQELVILAQRGMPAAKYGIPRGTWFWTGAVLGDASGGSLTMLFTLSVRVKTDWVLSLVNGSWLKNNSTAAGVKLTWNSGPIFRDPLAALVTNPSWREQGAANTNAAEASFSPEISRDERLIAVGEPALAGGFTIAAWETDVNTDTVSYQVSMWGLVYDWKTFYRGQGPQSPL